MYDEQNPISSLVHLYIDGAFDRRELVRRVARYTGSVAAAIAALGGFEIMQAQAPSACPDGIRVPVDAPDLIVREVEYPGEDSKLFGHLAYPAGAVPYSLPGVIVVHENRGLVEHIRDVTRRVARAGFVALGVDLLSRQGGSGLFTDAQQQAQAYGRTTTLQRRADIISSLAYLKTLEVIIFNRIGLIGFCAGGGNVWEQVVNVEEYKAAVPFYGTPAPQIDAIERIKTPVLAIYAERDRNLTLSMAPVMTAMVQQQKTFGFHVYEGVGHAFHNDTGAAYNAAAACDAWGRTIDFFNKWLRPRE